MNERDIFIRAWQKEDPAQRQAFLDGGAMPSGQPFFVVELVKGAPVTRFCDLHQLHSRQRLELFVSVCQAVQHAHQKPAPP